MKLKVLVSGSSSGIGRAITELLLMQKHTVIGLARNHHKFQPDNPDYITYAVDFSAITQLENNLKTVRKAHDDLDVIICSAGYGEFSELEQFSVVNMQAMMNVNFLSQAVLVKNFLPQLKKKQKGKIILLGSECALEGQKKGSIYCASKFALRGFAQSLRKECAAAQISVTLINPGMVATPFFDALNFRPAAGGEYAIQAEQIANLVGMLVGEGANCVYEEINLQPMKKGVEKRT